MGALTSRQNAGVEEVDVATNHAYKYPPKSGNYFGSHFIMGGERFDTPQPEAYLFGENSDLNFLGSRPTPFPYPPPQANEPTKTLKSLVNIRKESLRLVKAVPPSGKTDSEKQPSFNIEFTFDSDARTAITIYYFATEEITSNGIIYNSKEPTLTSETFNYNKGANQQFVQPSHSFEPSRFSDEDLLYNPDKEIIPVAIHCVAQETTDESRQSHTSIAVLERHLDGTYVIKALKQKIFVDGLCYLLQEIYGIENKNLDNSKIGGGEMDTEDNGSECVICMCDTRDTLILPCRHLCLCNSCADSLRYQANNCPICRAPFRALLQIRALQKTGTSAIVPPPTEGSCENIPTGYEGVSLIEALNGPMTSIRRSPPPSLAPQVETQSQGAQQQGGVRQNQASPPPPATAPHHHNHSRHRNKQKTKGTGNKGGVGNNNNHCSEGGEDGEEDGDWEEVHIGLEGSPPPSPDQKTGVTPPINKTQTSDDEEEGSPYRNRQNRHQQQKRPASEKTSKLNIANNAVSEESPGSEGNVSQVRMSVLLAREIDNGKSRSPIFLAKKSKGRPKDTVKTISETSHSQEEGVEEDLDSEAEKLSPLLEGQDEAKDGPIEDVDEGHHLQRNSGIAIGMENPLPSQRLLSSHSQPPPPPPPPPPSSSSSVNPGITGGEDSEDFYTPPEDPTAHTILVNPVTGQVDKVEGMLKADVLPRVSC